MMKEIEIMDMARTNGFRLGNAQDRQGGTGCTVLVLSLIHISEPTRP